jgi:hypothetical protein
MNKTNLVWLAGFIWASLVLFACKTDDPDKPYVDDPIEDSLVIQIAPKIIGFMPYEVSESSGMVMTTQGRMWSHNDSGGNNELYCINFSGQLLRTLVINNAINVDWEELCIDKQKHIYIGDFGNNNNVRKNLKIYRIPDPETLSGSDVEAETIFFSYEDQAAFPPPDSERNFDVEAMVWKNDSLFLFTKDRSSPSTGITKLYKLPASPGTHIARLAGSFYVGNTTTTARITSADIDPESGDLVLLAQEKLIIFRNYPGNQFFRGKKTEYPFVPMPGKVEAIFFSSRKKLYMTEEISTVNLGNLYEVNLP